MQITFEHDGSEFSALSAAERWCRERGISSGSPERDSPIGLMLGDVTIAKWRNLSGADRKALDGTIAFDGGIRSGSARIEMRRMP